MDKYITRTVISNNDCDDCISVEYDFTILDPGIEFEIIHEAPNGVGSFNCLRTIASSNHIELFQHPLPAKLLKTKWSKFGSRIYGGNLAVYIAFIIALSTYVVQIGLYKQSHFPEIHFIGFLRPSNVSTPIPTIVPSPSFIPFHDDHDNVSTVDIELRRQQTSLLALQLLIAIFSGLNIIRELFQMYQERFNYLLSIENYMELALHVTVFVFINFATANKVIWCTGSFAVLLSFIDLIMFLRKLPYIGKYVLMLRSMASTALKVSIIATVLVTGFAVSFSMLCNRQVEFYSFVLSLIKVVVMTVGEIDYDTLLSGIRTGTISFPNSYMVLLQLILFMLLMPILMMNLMIGLAVGDIAAMEKKASLERLVDLTEFFHRTEKALPIYFRRYCVLDKVVCIEKIKKDKQIRKSKDELMQDHSDFIHDMEAINRRLKAQRLKLDALDKKINLIQQCSEKVSPPT